MAVRKDKILIFREDSTCELVGVEEVSEEAVLTKNGMYDLSAVDKRIDTTNGYVLYVTHTDIAARQEAVKLRQLRKSTALKRMFEFNVDDKTDWMKYIPYIIIAMLILFRR